MFGCVSLYSQEHKLGFWFLNPQIKFSGHIPPKLVAEAFSTTGSKQVYYILNPQFLDSGAKQKSSASLVNKKPDFISIHGNVMYDYYYQSHLDTPYEGASLQQHTISTFLDIKVKDAYPLRVAFTTRLGSTNYLSNFSTLNLRFDKSSFAKDIKQKAQNWIKQQANPDSSYLQSIKNQFDEKKLAYKDTKKWLSSPSVMQAMIKAKEILLANRRKLAKHLNSGTDSTNNISKQIQSSDSTYNSLVQVYNKKMAQVDTLKKGIDSLGALYSKEKKSWDSSKNAVASSMSEIKDPKQWKNALKNLGTADSILPKGYKTLLAINKLSIGTSVVDYSELSAKNITISGLQVEYIPKLYYAVAGGVINYRFRDYLLPESSGSKQYLGLIRFGKGTPESNHLIFTYYFGRKSLYEYAVNDTNTNQHPDFLLMGLTLEKQVAITRNINLSAEIAKSTIPYYNRVDQNSKFTQGAFVLSDHSNEAYSLKANAIIPESHTKLDGYFKHYGENFQSFSLFSSNTRQNAWLVHAEQTLLKDQLNVNASVRKNDFVNPFLNQQYTSNIVFKSLQATLRVRKLPVLSVGYYPTSQLTKIGDNAYSENLFYSLIGSLNYYYRLWGVQMSSNILATRFYNKPLDSGFVYYNSRNILFNHMLIFRSISLTGEFTKSFANTYNLSTTTGGIQWKIKKWLTIGSAIKYNYQSIIQNTQLGYSFNSTVVIPVIGTIQVRVQKTFIPGPESQLVPDNVGRLTYYRNF